jgi:hypothetical protein
MYNDPWKRNKSKSNVGKTNFGRGTYTTKDLIFIIGKYSSDLLS